jgi:hypothetical protein
LTPLEVWCSPQTFFKKMEDLAKTITTEELFNAPQLGFVLETMILAEFAIKLEGAQKVRLATGGEKYPDGFVETPTGNLGIEVTEVDREARRRGDEYKSGAAPRDSADDSEEKAKVISTELERNHRRDRCSIHRQVLYKALHLVQYAPPPGPVYMPPPGPV